MIQLYPMNPVVCENDLLAEQYNKSRASIYMASQCLSEKAVEDMISQGAEFDSVICVGDAGQKLFSDVDSANEEKLSVEAYRLSSSKSFDEAINDIHTLIKNRGFVEGMG